MAQLPMWLPLKQGGKFTSISREVESKWTILSAKADFTRVDDLPGALKWAQENAKKEVFATHHNDSYQIGFEDATDALLFKMAFPNYRKTNE